MLALLLSVISLVAASLLNNRLASTLPRHVFFVHPLLFFNTFWRIGLRCFSIIFLTSAPLP